MSCSKEDINKAVDARLKDMITNFDPKSFGGNTQIANMVASMGMPQNKMNGILNNLQSMIMCDTDCQRRKRTDELRRKWTQAKKTEKEAPGNVEDAERNFYVFSKGEVGYKQMLVDRYTKVANKRGDKAEGNHETLMKELDALVSDYNAETQSLARIRELLRIRLNENKELKLAIDSDVADVETNDRRVVYEDWAKDWLNKVRSLLVGIYFVIIAFYFLYSPIISIMRGESIGKYLEMYRLIKNAALLTLAVLTPWLVTWILRRLYVVRDVAEDIVDMTPYRKNVFRDLTK